MNALFKRFWNLRLIRWGGCIIVALLSSYTVFCVYANWSGPRHWVAVKARLESEGETLDFVNLLPPRVDKATNFCAIEVLDGIALEGDEQSPQGRKRKALEELGWESLGAPLIQGNMSTCEKTDFEAWARFARDTNFVHMPPDSGCPARDLLQAFDQSQPLLKVVADAALARPGAAFTPLLRDRSLKPPFVLFPVPHYASVFRLQNALSLRAQAAGECGDNAAAIASVQAMLRISDAVSQEPLWIGMLVSLTCDMKAGRAIWARLEKRTAGDKELQSLQDGLDRMNIEPRFLAAMRGELAAAIDSFDFEQHKSGRGAFAELVKEEGSAEPVPWTMKVLSHLLPTGMTDESKAVLVGLEYEGVIKPLKTGGYASLKRCESKMNAELEPRAAVLHPGRFIASRTLPKHLPGLIGKFYGTLAVNRQAIIACALERYYLLHKTYPAVLAGLVPQFISSVPNDPMDDQPMRYRQTSDCRYMLWSVGFDLKDDNGDVSPSGQNYKRDYKGDWTWQYQPVK